MTSDSLVRLRWRWWDVPSDRIRRAARYLRTKGPAAFAERVAHDTREARYFGRGLEEQYRHWVRAVALDSTRVTDADLFAHVARAPRFLLIGWLPHGRQEESEPLLRSLRQQPYPHWHLWLVGHLPVEDRTEERIYLQNPGEKRLHVAKGDRDHWDRARAVNEIVAAAVHTTHVGFLDLTDRLAPESLLRLTERIFADDPEILYMDEDQEMPWGERGSPRFKPEWSPELLLSYHYFGHLTLYRRDLFLATGGLRSTSFRGLEYDLALRATERDARVAHIPHVLCHRAGRRRGGFRAVLGTEEGGEGAEEAIREALRRRGVEADVVPARLSGAYRVRPHIAAERRVSIIVPTRDRVDLLKRCVKDIEKHTPPGPWELVVMDNASRENRTHRYLQSISHRVINDPGPFNFARLMNAAVRQTAGDVLVFLNNDTRVREGWLVALLEALALPGVGAAGGKLLYPRGTVQHAGLVLGVGVVAGNSHKHLPGSLPGHLGSLQVLRNYSAVTAACLAVNRDAFDEAGGFDEALASSFQDVDLCLRLARRGRRTVFTPWCVVVHHETASRSPTLDEGEIELMRARWGEALEHDPYYHPLLTRERENFEMARWDVVYPR